MGGYVYSLSRPRRAVRACVRAPVVPEAARISGVKPRLSCASTLWRSAAQRRSSTTRGRALVLDGEHERGALGVRLLELDQPREARLPATGRASSSTIAPARPRGCPPPRPCATRRPGTGRGKPPTRDPSGFGLYIHSRARVSLAHSLRAFCSRALFSACFELRDGDDVHRV